MMIGMLEPSEVARECARIGGRQNRISKLPLATEQRLQLCARRVENRLDATQPGEQRLHRMYVEPGNPMQRQPTPQYVRSHALDRLVRWCGPLVLANSLRSDHTV